MFSEEFATYPLNISKPFSVECFHRMTNLRTFKVSSFFPDISIDSLLDIGRKMDQMTSRGGIFYKQVLIQTEKVNIDCKKSA